MADPGCTTLMLSQWLSNQRVPTEATQVWEICTVTQSSHMPLKVKNILNSGLAVISV